MTCEYCKERALVELPMKTNCDTSRTWALIAQGDKKKEIVFVNKGCTYGIEISYCPICGQKLNGPKVNPDYARECGY